MTDGAVRSRNESMQQRVSCGWCREEAAVELDGRAYCGTCFLWIAVRQQPAGMNQLRGSLASTHFARANASSR